jgi:hypothetical protein
MNNRVPPKILLLVAVVLLPGCTRAPADFCKLLAPQEVRQAHPEAIIGKMEEWHKSSDHPTWYCTWKDAQGKNLFSLSAGFATSNSPSAILRTYSGKNDRLVELSGLGRDAAVLFYTGDDGSGRFTVLARDDKWNLDIRSSDVGDENSGRFQAVKELASKAFSRLSTDKEFAKLRR